MWARTRTSGAGLSPSTERHSASQATAGSEQSGHAVTGGAARAAISWASSPRHRRRSRADICDQACGRPSLSVEIHVRRAAARRFFPTSGFSTERVRGQHAGSQMHGRLCRPCRAEEDRCPVFASRAASADRYESTCYRVTRCETGHNCCRAAHWRTACVSCGMWRGG